MDSITGWESEWDSRYQRPYFFNRMTKEAGLLQWREQRLNVLTQPYGCQYTSRTRRECMTLLTCMYVCVCVCMYVCVYIYLHMRTHTHISRLSLWLGLFADWPRAGAHRLGLSRLSCLVLLCGARVKPKALSWRHTQGSMKASSLRVHQCFPNVLYLFRSCLIQSLRFFTH